jgi:hypothetical protein
MADRRDPRERPASDPPQRTVAAGSGVGRKPAADEVEIIELTEVVDLRGQEIIELTDVVNLQGEDIIELTDVVAPRGEDIIDLTDPVAGPGDEEDLLRLADAAEKAPALAAGGEEDLFDLGAEMLGTPATHALKVTETAPEGEEKLYFSISELPVEALGATEEPGREPGDSLALNLEADLGVITDEDLDFNLSTQELSEAIDMLDTELGTGDSRQPSPAQRRSLEETVTSERVEAALERVISRMYAEKIDRLLEDAIKRTVSQEIQHLRRQLLDNDADES